ncbi:MAG: M14 family zinc carboxypeptidase, partial [Longimicrobiales bacterium]|nr:M14 family zinc carboxypeptidase [Longimicrobiales bacterium]
MPTRYASFALAAAVLALPGLVATGLVPPGLAPAALSAQVTPPDHPPATLGAESERNPGTYALEAMGRHGPSHFPRVRHPEVEYEAGETLTFDRYHTVDVMYTWLERWAEWYPDLVELYQVGTSLEGRPILQVTLTNKATGPATDKPAAFFEGGRHSGEITSSESVLWLIQHLVEGYGRDGEITDLLDRAAIHLKPQNNPDGSNLYLHTAQTNRSSVRPIDNDGDGLLDEDPANDLDGDGLPDSLDGLLDVDGDGVPNFLDVDSDNDGLTDHDEVW